MTIKPIVERIEAVEAEIAAKEAELRELKSKLMQETHLEFLTAFTRSDKSHGSVTLTIDDIPLTYTLKQTVSWDQKALRELWESLPVEAGDKIIELKFSVPERVFNAITDDAILNSLIDARTTKLSQPTITIKK
jgi:ribosomal protein L9